jgi:hypothetical protein
MVQALQGPTITAGSSTEILLVMVQLLQKM